MIWMLVIGSSAVLLVVLGQALLFSYHRRPNPANRTEAVNNARQIGMALFEFETEYGDLPNSSTAAAVRRKTGTTLTLSDRTSNDLFAQLIASGVTQDERPFYATSKSSRKTDGIFNTDSTFLEHGECGFAYISGLDCSKSDLDTPILFGPVIPGTTTLDQKSCYGKAIVLSICNSATTYPINSAGKIILPNGLDLLDPRQPFWHGRAPDVKWPK